MKDFKLDSRQMMETQRQVDMVNKKLRAEGKKPGEGLGKDSFLKLLVTELTHQDPTEPMKDREFMSQMAQFSSLEQMSNVSKEMSNLYKMARSGEAYSLIGKNIEAFNTATGRTIRGKVSHAVKDGEMVSLMVNKEKVSLEDIHAVYPEEGKKAVNIKKENSISTKAKALEGKLKSLNNQLNNLHQPNDNVIRAFEANSRSLVK